MNPLDVSMDNIESYKQNHPYLVAADLETYFGVPREATLNILMARGINKWLHARRDMIHLKHHLKQRLRYLDGIEHKTTQEIYAALQHIANQPRYREWGPWMPPGSYGCIDNKPCALQGREM